MKLLFVTDAPMIGGSEVYLREMLPRLKARGLKPEAALPDLEGNRPIREALSASGVRVWTYKNLEQVPPDAHALVLASAWYPQNHVRFRQHFKPRPAILVHDQIEMQYPLGLGQVYRLGYSLLQAPNLRVARAVLTVSNWAKAFLEQTHRVPQVWAVPNGIDALKFSPVPDLERQALRQKLGMGRLTFLVSARMSPEKNHLVVMALAERFPQVDFWLVGTGELAKLWQGYARLRRLTNVHFLGRRGDMPDLYRAADGAIQPTLGENQSLATLEAMSSGLPVLTTNIQAQLEIVQDGVTGLLAPASVGAMTGQFRRLVEDAALRERLGLNARAFVLQRHTLEQCADRLSAAIQSVLAAEAQPTDFKANS